MRREWVDGLGVGGKKEVMLADMGVAGCGERAMERKEWVRVMVGRGAR